MSDTILPNCCSVAICNKVAKFNIYCQHNEIRRINFRMTLIIYKVGKVNKITSVENTRTLYSIDGNNRFQVLQNIDSKKTPNTVYEILTKHKKYSEATVPLKEKCRKQILCENANIAEKKKSNKIML